MNEIGFFKITGCIGEGKWEKSPLDFCGNRHRSAGKILVYLIETSSQRLSSLYFECGIKQCWI
jgi:hypothetical protein